MKIIIPMAGMGKRMRPHTLTVPKPLIPVAGKAIVQHLVEDIARVCEEKIEEVAFIIGRFGEETEKNLISIAENIGAKGSIYYQDTPLGTAHAVYMAEKSLGGNVIVAFADTLFVADFTLNKEEDAIIWVHKVENPSQFGVVLLNEDGYIRDFAEKPKQYVSDLAIIGIYYFKDGDNLRAELKYLLDNNIVVNGEYQLTDALQNMKNKGKKFAVGKVQEWLDCGNKEATVLTNASVLKHKGHYISPTAVVKNSKIVEPCYIGAGVVIENSVVGGLVSLGSKSVVKSSVVSNSIVQTNAVIDSIVVSDSMIGNYSNVQSSKQVVNIGDYSQR